MKNIVRKAFLLAVVFFQIGCNEKRDIVYTYYPNGKLHIKVESIGENRLRKTTYHPDHSYTISYWKDTLLHGMTKEYYTDGTLKSVTPLVDGKVNGRSIIYHSNGKIEQISFRKHDIRLGPQTQYYDNGRLWRVIDFVSLQGKETEMGFVEYDRQGKLLQETTRAVIQPASDTLDIGESTHVRFQLLKVPLPTTRLLLNGFNEQFRPDPSLRMDTVQCAADHSATFSFKARQPGLQYIRGVAENYQVVDKKGDTLTIKAKHVYFEQPVYVKPINK